MKEQILDNIFQIGVFFGIILATFLVAFLVGRFFRRLIRRSAASLDSDPTNYQFLRHIIVAVVYVVGFGIAIYTIPNLRTLASSMLAGAGILAVAVGFASQSALSNVISGLFIVIFKPFRVNDRLQLRTFSGIVEDITLRHTVIRDFENKRVVVPNSLISDEIIINSNFSEDKICRWIDVGISYDSDIDLAKYIMADEVGNHPLYLDTRSEEQIAEGAPKVNVRVLSLGESSVNLRAWAWASNSPDGFTMACDLFESIKKRFDREGVEIPFPHRTLVHKNRAIG
ncbi:MAG: mechanosensitive ion channel family protein [Bacteroidota bacterium]